MRVRLIAEDEVDVLGRYNAERARGLVHTPEWDERMAVLQARFDEDQRLYLVERGAVPFGENGWLIPPQAPRSWWARLLHR